MSSKDELDAARQRDRQRREEERQRAKQERAKLLLDAEEGFRSWSAFVNSVGLRDPNVAYLGAEDMLTIKRSDNADAIFVTPPENLNA